jgi:hypothetical protein
MKTPRRSRRANAAGYSLVELLVALGVTTLIMGATMVGLTDAVRTNDSVMQITGMNSMLRASMDLLVLDLMQAGAGLPDQAIGKPSGAQAQPIYLPGPPGSEFAEEFVDDATNGTLAAVISGPGYGPTINGVETDTITMLIVDDSLIGIGVKNITPTSVDAEDAGIDFEDPPYRVAPGQLLIVSGGGCTTLVQVTNVLNNGKIMFSANDSMNLNQPQAKEGSLSALKDCASEASIIRVRMIGYYIDATTNPNRPRLVRRINNGDPDVLNNDLGTAVGLDIENLQFSYDILVGNTLQTGVEAPADASQIRKVNVTLSARSKNAAYGSTSARVHRNTLTTQVSLRGLSLTNRYLGTTP